jgi:putative endonuclease
MKSYRLGLFAEYLAMLIYKVKFYNIVHHRKKNFVGEIDIIACKGRQLVFIEVKARKNNITENIVSQSQQNRIKRSAELFLSYNHKYDGYDIRFDLVFIQPYKWPIIIKNAW